MMAQREREETVSKRSSIEGRGVAGDGGLEGEEKSERRNGGSKRERGI